MFGIEDYSKPIVDFSNFDVSQLGDALLFGASIMLIGMVTIFAVLCILWLFLIVFKLVFQNLGKNKAAKKNTAVAPVVNENATKPSQPDDGEIIAVIAAAIAMAESESSGLKFRVVSFRRV